MQTEPASPGSVTVHLERNPSHCSVGRVTGRLPKELADEVVGSVLELFSYQIRDAIGHISRITHPYENDEMLDQMFGEFCLGK